MVLVSLFWKQSFLVKVEKTSEEVRTLVFPDESSRNALLALLERLQTDHRSFRRRGASLLTWLPAGCVAGCLPCMARAKPPGVPHDPSENSPRLAIRSEASGRHRPDATGGHLEEFKAYARQLWDRQSASSSIRMLLRELLSLLVWIIGLRLTVLV